MLYFHNSCTILKPIDYHLVSDFNICHSICAHTLVRLERHRLNTYLQEVKRNSGLNCLKFVVSVSEVLVVWSIDICRMIFNMLILPSCLPALSPIIPCSNHYPQGIALISKMQFMLKSDTVLVHGL